MKGLRQRQCFHQSFKDYIFTTPKINNHIIDLPFNGALGFKNLVPLSRWWFSWAK
ncbi:hypothetical protein Syun_029162 [Stephania yunnanensis]|uniref:Uncharacterized protein n=1 Tax=Stephania yunnanensis TaxID=152371 RepID=A0AAP0ECQ4_9MAGN